MANTTALIRLLPISEKMSTPACICDQKAPPSTPIIATPTIQAPKIPTAKKEAQEKYDKVIEEIKESIEFITDAKSANEFASHINEFEHVGSSLMMARSLFAAKVKALGLIFNKETKIYSDAA